MEQRKTDHRVQYTKYLIRQTVLDLLEAKPVERITVKELCEKADLSRGTFYSYYASAEDVLHQIQDEFVREQMRTFNSYWQEDRNLNVMEQLVKNLGQQRKLCLLLMGKNGDSAFIEKLHQQVMDQVLEEWVDEFPNLRQPEIQPVFRFVVAGAMRVLLDWMQEKNSMTETELTHFLETMGHYCLEAAGELNL